MAERIILIRHGETEWSKSGQHTSTTDLALTERGQTAAAGLPERLMPFAINKAFSSPRRRAMDTAALALPDHEIEVAEDLSEWNYGRYEGLTSDQIHERDPKWVLWTDGAPGGESPEQVANRAQKMIELAADVAGTVAFFAHGHILRVIGLTWLDLDMSYGERLTLDTSSVSALGFAKGQRALLLWND